MESKHYVIYSLNYRITMRGPVCPQLNILHTIISIQPEVWTPSMGQTFMFRASHLRVPALFDVVVRIVMVNGMVNGVHLENSCRLPVSLMVWSMTMEHVDI